MDVSSRTHPHFANPPVIETVLSIEFARLAGWQIPHFGLYWSTIRARYPKLNVQGVLPSQIEDLSDDRLPSKNVQFSLSQTPLVRCWFYNQAETQLIQIQNDRFIFNWKRGLMGEPYPHYENIRPIVLHEWSQFAQFVAGNELGNPEISQCEVTYINHIEKGLGWKDYGELDQVVTCWAGTARSGSFPIPEDVDVGIRYRMPNRLGRMYIRIQPAIRDSDHKEIIQLSLTARGRPESPEPERAFEWFDFAQALVARSFVEITTKKMHDLWGIEVNS